MEGVRKIFRTFFAEKNHYNGLPCGRPFTLQKGQLGDLRYPNIFPEERNDNNIAVNNSTLIYKKAGPFLAPFPL
jgi:hypothetical protein